MLKRLYAQNQDGSSSRISHSSSGIGVGWNSAVGDKTQTKQQLLKRNLSGKQLRTHLPVSRESES